jgi:hypothetical protein
MDSNQKEFLLFNSEKKTEQPQVKIDEPKITPSQPSKKVSPPPSSSPSTSRQSTSWNQTS